MSNIGARPVRAVIFDLDGLLIDSEPLWQRAEAETFAQVGLTLAASDCQRTIGMRCDAVVEHWLAERGWDVQAHPPAVVEQLIVARVIELVQDLGRLRPGVARLLDLLDRQGLPLAVASSSPSSIIDVTLASLGIDHRFAVTRSAESETRGKPDPGVYLSAARALGVEPEACLALEDSLPGLRAAVAAGMRCVVVPDPTAAGAPELAAAAAVLDTLEQFDEHLWARLTATPVVPGTFAPALE